MVICTRGTVPKNGQMILRERRFTLKRACIKAAIAVRNNKNGFVAPSYNAVMKCFREAGSEENVISLTAARDYSEWRGVAA